MKAQAATEEALAWLCERAGCQMSPLLKGIEVRASDGRIRGVIGFDGWTDNAVMAHMAVESPSAWRYLIPAGFHYAFHECGKGLLMGAIPADNRASRKMAVRLGLRPTYRIKDGWAQGVDMVLHEMRREECRYLAPRKAA